MYQPPGLNKLITSPSKRKGIPKTLLAFFFVLMYVFGLDFGFTKVFSKTIQPLSKALSFIVTFLVAFILTTGLNTASELYWCIITLIQYILFFVIIRMSKYTPFDFMLEVHGIDERITRINKEMVGIVTWIYVIVMYTSKGIIFYTNYELKNYVYIFVPTYVYGIFSLGVDFISVIKILIYYYIYSGVKYLNELAKTMSSIRILRLRYMAIADCCDKILPLYNKVVLLELLLEIPKMMGLIWNMLNYIKENNGWLVYVGQCVYATHIMLHIIGSAAIVQLTNSQVNALKLQLHSILVDEKDDKKSSEISRFLQYIEIRRLQYDVGGVIPVDMRLPASVFSVCSTYMIVVVQLTHLYD